MTSTYRFAIWRKRNWTDIIILFLRNWSSAPVISRSFANFGYDAFAINIECHCYLIFWIWVAIWYSAVICGFFHSSKHSRYGFIRYANSQTTGSWQRAVFQWKSNHHQIVLCTRVLTSRSSNNRKCVWVLIDYTASAHEIKLPFLLRLTIDTFHVV